MLNLTYTSLSHVKIIDMKHKLKYYTEPLHCTSTLLVAVAARGNFEHSCTGFGGVSAGVAWASVRILKFYSLNF